MGDGQFPVNRLKVRFTDSYVPDKKKIYSAYFPGICAWVKELTLEMDMKMYRVWFPEDIVTFPTDCVYKDLTSFNLRLIQWTDLCQESWNGFTNFVRCILENSPNLRDVNVVYGEDPAWDAENFAICLPIENLFPILTSVGTSKLSTINVKLVPLEKKDLAKWSSLNLKLRKLVLTVSRCSKTNELLSKFLETQTGTLKTLNLNRNHWDSEAPAATFAFPRLEKLEQLRMICDGVIIYSPVTFAGIDYARLFPCLKILDLKDDCPNWRDFLGNDLLPPTNTVEELRFPWNLDHGVDLTPNPAVIAGKVFTGLKKLQIHPDQLFTQAVYENMPNLEVLSFYNFSFGTHDNIITGLGLEVCWKFRGVMANEWIEKLQNAEGRSIARLQNLKTLKLTHCWYDGRLCFSRLSLHVFKKMSSLKCLDLFDGCADAAERCSANEDQKQFLEELRANFVVL